MPTLGPGEALFVRQGLRRQRCGAAKVGKFFQILGINVFKIHKLLLLLLLLLLLPRHRAWRPLWACWAWMVAIASPGESGRMFSWT